MEINNSVFQFGNFTLKAEEHSLHTDHQEIYLRPKLFETLFLLIERNGHTVKKQELLNSVWPDVIVSENTLYKCIEELRRILLDKPHNPRFIQTIPGIGFKFIAQVKKISSDSLAVLPFTNLSGDSGQDYLADGFTEILIADLSKILSIRVISRTSVMVYKKLLKTLPYIANDLNVDLVVEGSVQCKNSGIQIIVQLIHAKTDRHIWSEIYEGTVKDIRNLQLKIAETIAGKLKPKINPLQKIFEVENISPAAYEEYLKGRYHLNKRSSKGFRKGIEYFEQAIKKDPGFASAYVGIADCYNMLANYDVLPPKEVYPKAKMAIAKAISIDYRLAETYISRAFVNMFYEWNWQRSKDDLLQAIQINPNCADAHHWYGLFLTIHNKFDDALVEMKKALSLDPLSMIINTNLGWIFYFARRYKEAIEQLEQSLELEPNFVSCHVKLGWVYEQLGMYDKAISQFQIALKTERSFALKAILGRTFALSDKKKEALGIIQRLTEKDDSNYVSPFLIANIYIGLNDKKNAIDWLGKAIEAKDGWMAWSNVDPTLDLIRNEPEFLALLESIGF